MGWACRKEPAVRPGARGTANLKQWNEQMEGLTSNGYLRSRMVRVRLLHYFICRLVGARQLKLPWCCLLLLRVRALLAKELVRTILSKVLELTSSLASRAGVTRIA
jgi:hypothetical protein